MISKIYHSTHIELHYQLPGNKLLAYTNWQNQLGNTILYNSINDLIVNGIATLQDTDKIAIPYEDLDRIDEFDYSALNLPEPYPFDIYVDLIGSGLKDINLKLKYSFQDFAHGNGSGNIVFTNKHRIGAYLNNNLEYLLTTAQLALITEIDAFNNKIFKNPNSVLKSIATIQEYAKTASATLSKVLLDTKIVAPKKFKIDIVKIAEHRYKLLPIIKKADKDTFQKQFEIFPRVKSEYSFRDKDKKVRVVIDDEKNESSSNMQIELSKLKHKNEYSTEELNENYHNITKFWDGDIVDLEDFGKRVLELGIYKPRFYPFISPFKSEWIPGILIDDAINGRRHLTIENVSELENLKKAVEDAESQGNATVEFKGEILHILDIANAIENAEKQLSKPEKPIATNSDSSDNQTKVLIIKENTDENDYSETTIISEEIRYHFHEIPNLAQSIQLKKHQHDGIAWLQTLSSAPYNLPGVLLADDMGLGKTIQVLYFVEWYFQNKSQKPTLVVAPVSLLENWQNEYAKFFPNRSMQVYTLWGKDVRNFINPKSKKETVANLSKPAIYLTTYETLRKQQIPLALINWGNVIVDEAQKIKTPGTFVTNAAKALKADFKIAMTGTPVENSLMDLWCIFDFCSPGLLDNAKEFSKQFQKPLKDENTNHVMLSEDLRKKIGHSLLRRMKSDVAKDLPALKIHKIEECMPREQHDAYMKELSEIEKLKEQTNNGYHILQGIFNLRSISDHPYLRHYRIETIDSDTLINTSAKLKKVMVLLSDIESKKEKAIVFTDSRAMQRILRRIISERFAIQSAIINGETPTSKAKSDKCKLTRQQEIDKYLNKEGFNVIIMSPVAAGFGLNVTGANHVIHYTRHWNPAKEQQATDRAYRIGQEKPVTVYYPLAIAPNSKIQTFDLILDELLRRKSHLASNTLFPTEQIEISTDEFVKSLSFDSKINKENKNDTIDKLEGLSSRWFKAAVSLLLQKVFEGSATKVVNSKVVDVLLFSEHKNLLVQIIQSSGKTERNVGHEILLAHTEYSRKYSVSFESYIITNSDFNDETIHFANQNSITLINREKVQHWLNSYNITFSELESWLLKLNKEAT